MKPFFEKVEYAPEDVILPTRSTLAAAWYDFFASEDVLVPSLFKALQKWEFLKPTFVPTHIKAFMPDDMVLEIANRSSNPLKLWLLLANWTWWVDADYYSNPDNDGHIQWIFWNMTSEDILIKKWQKIRWNKIRSKTKWLCFSKKRMRFWFYLMTLKKLSISGSFLF